MEVFNKFLLPCEHIIILLTNKSLKFKAIMLVINCGDDANVQVVNVVLTKRKCLLLLT